MIERDLEPILRQNAAWFPVVTVTGPRQSGKTTLCRTTFPDRPYVTLEPADTRSRIRGDPRAFLERHRGGAIIDEIQHVPELLTYVQEAVDEDPSPGRFVLTGSQHFGLAAAVTQSLAGRTAILELLPPSLTELRRFKSEITQELWRVVVTGAYPRIYDREIPAERWLANYTTTYVERDARQILEVENLEAFVKFVRLAAGRTAQEVNLSALGSDAGVSHNTARSWLSVLETSYLCTRIPAWHVNIKKRLVKSPKLHFLDSGLVCHLLGISTAEQLLTHPLRGPIFESWVISEILKAHFNRGQTARLFHLRAARGLEVDLVIETDAGVSLVEAKSGATFDPDHVKSLRKATEILRNAVPGSFGTTLVHGGNESSRFLDHQLISWSDIADHDWTRGSPPR